MKTVTVFLAPGFEEIEAVTPIDYLRRAGAEVTTVAVPVVDQYHLAVAGAHGISVSADMLFADYEKKMKGSLPDAVFIPGGMPGAANIASFLPVLELIRNVFAAGNLVTAICAAPAVVLSKTGVLAHHHFTCYPGMEKQIGAYCGEKTDDLMNGSIHISGKPFITDGNLVTGRGPGTAEQFALELVRILCGSDSAQKIKESSLLR